ncbi:MAG: beta-ketoacyl synthase [Flavobacteriales bacterium]|nr:beta-ketoacyl synthase [Flavobacteriales bacterium]MCX7767664.1 beta-ketoacyl synthase [Flavobacteriales bacterium]MDW8409494.1 beta-ketoacyl synthase N-terminal-like domain-containing protein [Flavobacteriales bacterium]
MNSNPVFVRASSLLTPYGLGVDRALEAMWAGLLGVRPVATHYGVFSLGCVEGGWCITPQDGKALARWETMLWYVAKEATEGLRPADPARAAIVVASTKGNIRHWPASQARRPYLHEGAHWLRDNLWPGAQVFTISMACISGLAAVDFACRLIRQKLCSDVLVVAADELTEFVVAGFSALKALSHQPCRPYDKHRDGINLAEAAAALWLTDQPCPGPSLGASAVAHDGVHISAPDRHGSGLAAAIRSVLEAEEILPSEISFVSAHGTATLYNDDMESTALAQLGLSEVPLHSLKGFLGHSLGAAALVELVIVLRAMTRRLMPASAGFTEPGTLHPLHVVTENYPLNENRPLVLKTSSGFGGCNAAIVVKG